MGYIRHDAIVVSGWCERRTQKAHEKAVEIGLLVTPIVISKVNAQRSFLIAPDGSKEGWPDSESGDAQRAEWIEWAKKEPELWIDWAHVNFGGDEPEKATLKEHNGK